MWVMIITFLFYSDVDRGNFSPAIESVEFSSKATCEAARAAYLGDLEPISVELNAAIASKRDIGDWRGPGGVVIAAVCVAK
jgi:hypothetical protein